MSGWAKKNNKDLEEKADEAEETRTDNRNQNFYSTRLLEDISTKLSTIIRQNNEAFNQEEEENGDT